MKRPYIWSRAKWPSIVPILASPDMVTLLLGNAKSTESFSNFVTKTVNVFHILRSFSVGLKSVGLKI